MFKFLKKSSNLLDKFKWLKLSLTSDDAISFEVWGLIR